MQGLCDPWAWDPCISSIRDRSCISPGGNLMVKGDMKKEMKHLYLPSAREVVQVDVPAMNFLMVDGEGDPNTTGDSPSCSICDRY